MSHSNLYTIAAVTLSIFAMAGLTASPAVALMIAALTVALIGVPHGGLDHWVGRRLLGPRFGNAWAVVFLPIYLGVGLLVAAAWYVAPLQTIVLFFLISAWHFGREDGLKHLEAMAVGGLIIWIPALARPAEMNAIVESLILSEGSGAEFVAANVVGFSQAIAFVLLPVAAWSFLFGSAKKLRVMGTATTLLAATTPILWSFPLFFCGWHSIRGLARMRAEEDLSWKQFAFYVAPLSMGALAIVVGAGFWLSEFIAAPSTQMRMLFIGLASIAVPHLFLHELENACTLGRLAHWDEATGKANYKQAR
ncbi:hypothetical protein LF1_12090 [Rubripirellula obstinata]|uniref:Probable beta-carotene 15,15'-dioxygenase n=1 Tax=Rubripirellula obstinata TaxID=406547 RepID=A0A5B1CC31_9BACT|nr:Brp/Blh family beta-carotene 15,15'-dioxygenase [Rubripirellula obstinata]KAA1258687.1 hypothetical protein LF1_12090 [Rubripirellula obstinata]